MNTHQVGTCSVELKTTPARPSILHFMLIAVNLAFLGGLMVTAFLPYLLQLSTWVLS